MNQKKCLCICCLALSIIIGLLLLAFVGVFVGIPFAYKKSVDSQRMLIFPTSELLPSDPEYTNFEKYQIYGVRNVHVGITTDNSISVGVWHVLPQVLINSSLQQNFDYSYSLARSQFPILLYFHSNGGNRIKFISMYRVLRKFFHVITFDYRGYADSSNATPEEEAIVQDSIRLYKWLRAQTNVDIYFWGHGIGSALSTHTISRLREESIVPKGLFLEAPFTSIRDQIQENSFYKLFKWLPWYESTMLDPLEKNGFVLNTTKYLLSVDCPVMVIHAKDDTITPYSLSESLYKIASENRTWAQGNITLHLLPESLNCGHYSIYRAPELLQYIHNHINICKAYNKRQG